MYIAKHTIVHGGKTFNPETPLDKKDLAGADIDRLLELKAIETSDLIGEATDPYAGMTAAQKKAAKKAEAEAEAESAAAADGLGDD